MTKTAPRPAVRLGVIRLHRWLGIGAALFWLVQAFTGMAIMFHWELRDAAISSVHHATDIAKIERRIDALGPAGSGVTIHSLWTTAGLPDRYDVFFSAADGSARSVRIAGDGSMLRDDGEGSVFDTLVGIHHNLLAGTTGDWIVAVSGMLLLTNLGFGLIAGWPRGRRWRAALTPNNKGPAVARFYTWHRAIGLWALLPAIVLVGTGTLLKFESGFGTLIGATDVKMPANPSLGAPIGFAAASRAALGAIPGSTLTAADFPTAEDATFRFRLRAPGEIRRGYGASIVLVDAGTARVRGTFPIAAAGPATRFMSALFPIHTGESGGVTGRLLTFALGLWLAVMVVAGLLLWWRRRPKARRARAIG